MFTFQLTHMIAFLAAIFLIGKCHANPTIRQVPELRLLCDGCGDKCDKCEFGVTISRTCGIPECRRGPGQICGGPSDTWGVCGDGMMCSCNRCTGCSEDNLACYTRPCLPHQSLDLRNRFEIDGLPIDSRLVK